MNSYNDSQCIKRRKRSIPNNLNDLNYYADSESDTKYKTDNETTFNFETIINSLSELNLNQNKELISNLIKRINMFEKKFEDITKLGIKIDNMQKNIDKIFVEKDYVIDSLKDEICNLKLEMKENYEHVNNFDKSVNNYFV